MRPEFGPCQTAFCACGLPREGEKIFIGSATLLHTIGHCTISAPRERYGLQNLAEIVSAFAGGSLPNKLSDAATAAPARSVFSDKEQLTRGLFMRRAKSEPNAVHAALVLKPFVKLSAGNVYKINFKSAYSLAPVQIVDAIKSGMPARILVSVAARMGISNDRLFNTLGLPRATADRKIRENKSLSSGESSRLLGIARLVGQVQTIVEESGDPEGFDAALWVAKWLEEPMPALGGRRPAEYMDTAEGQALIANLVARAQTGTYA